MAITFDYDETHEAFRFTLDGEARPLIPRLEGLAAKMESFDELMRVEHTTEDGLLDALVAYDQTNALGGREWLVENITVEQLILILQRIVRVHA